MNIVSLNKNKYVLFHKIEAGDLFIHDTAYYMKMSGDACFNAVNLSTGYVRFFAEKVEVVPIDSVKIEHKAEVKEK